MIGSAEKAGSGVNKILDGWSSAHWRRPYVTIDTEPDRITLEMPMFSIIPEDTLSDLKKLFGDNVETLGKDELTALAVCHIEGDITNNRLQYVIDKHKTDITKMLQDLCKNGYLIPENKSRWTTYRLNMDSSNVDSSNVDSSNVDDKNLKEQIKTSRLSYDDLSKIIIKTCALEYKSASEIALEINKAEKYLKNNILPKMLSEEKLLKLYPDYHPDQKYMAKSK